MSTVVVVKKNGIVAIAADTLTTRGARKLSAVHNQQPGKIVRLGDTFLGITGWTVSQQVLGHAYRDLRDVPAMSNKSEIFDMFLALHVRLKEDYFLNPGYFGSDPYELTHMSALIANSHGIFGVNAMRDVTEYQRFWASGSGSDYALGAMHAVYESAGAQAIAEAGVSAGIEFDDASGAPIESYVVPVVPTVQELELLLKM